MIIEVMPGIFQLKIPLPKNPLKVLNSYLVLGEGRSLLIDTGFNWPVCRDAMFGAVESLQLNWSDIDFFLTHMHTDHSGLVYHLAREDSAVFCSEPDAGIIRSWDTQEYWHNLNSFYLMHGYPEKDLVYNVDAIKNDVSGSGLKFTYVAEGDTLKYGSYNFTCISTPGHTPGHMCLYESTQGLLIAGDHILDHITSNIAGRPGGADTLGLYLQSLEKVERMNIAVVLPGHRSLIYDCNKRIAELRQHHENRLLEVLSIMQSQPLSAYQVASRMHWDIKFDSWEEIPKQQKWFATGEAIAHLDHLAAQNKLNAQVANSIITFHRVR